MKRLVYTGVSLDYPRLQFHYRLANQATEHAYWLSLDGLPRACVPSLLADPTWYSLCAHIGLAFIPHLYGYDYYDKVEIACLQISAEGVALLHQLLYQGLGEHKYRYGLPLHAAPTIQITGGPPVVPAPVAGHSRVLLCNGGGKDTAVAAELLKEAGQPFSWFCLGYSPAMQRLMAVAGEPSGIIFSKGRRNAAPIRYPGHKPFSAILFFAALLPAYIHGFDRIAVGNEYSSECPNLTREGFAVNHQYTKSFAFEQLFQAYAVQLLPSVRVFSLLRPFGELQLLRRLAEYPQYHAQFVSCNNYHYQDRWCGSCAKCVFTYLAACVFNLPRLATAISGPDSAGYPDSASFQRMVATLAEARVKPFDCIGNVEEIVWLLHQYHCYCQPLPAAVFARLAQPVAASELAAWHTRAQQMPMALYQSLRLHDRFGLTDSPPALAL